MGSKNKTKINSQASNSVLNLKGKNVKKNSQKRRERSKISARSRRNRESQIFKELCGLLPIPQEFQETLDKSTIIRLAICDLKLNNFIEQALKTDSKPEKSAKNSYDYLITQAVNGFIFVLSAEGRIIYISPSVKCHLGLSQVDLMGQSLYDYTHPGDQNEVNELLLNDSKKLSEIRDNFHSIRSKIFRMKYTKTRRERNYNLRLYSYKAINCTGRVINGRQVGIEGSQKWIIGIGEPLICPESLSIPQTPLEKHAFLTHHTKDMNTTWVEQSIKIFLGYNPEDLLGISFYEFYHASDLPKTVKSIYSMLAKGQGQTEMFRFLAKNGGWVWVVTEICSQNCQKNNVGSQTKNIKEVIVCQHFVVSQIENPHEILSEIQIDPKKYQNACRRESVIAKCTQDSIIVPCKINSSAEIEEKSKPIPLACKIMREKFNMNLNDAYLQDEQKSSANITKNPIPWFLRDVINTEEQYNPLLTSESMDIERTPSFYQLTREDCEVNAPIKGHSFLLQGSDLLKALELEDRKTSKLNIISS